MLAGRVATGCDRRGCFLSVSGGVNAAGCDRRCRTLAQPIKYWLRRSSVKAFMTINHRCASQWLQRCFIWPLEAHRHKGMCTSFATIKIFVKLDRISAIRDTICSYNHLTRFQHVVRRTENIHLGNLHGQCFGMCPVSTFSQSPFQNNLPATLC